MTFSISKFFGGHKSSSNKGDTTPSTPSSNASPANSRATSLYSESLPTTPDEKYLHDPMRNNKHADYLGGYVDPMGSRSHFTQGVDVTNTGA